MPDFRIYIREHLPLLGLPGAREAELIEELALDFEQRYEQAIRGGAAPSDAWNSIVNQVDWAKLAAEFRVTLAGSRAIEVDFPNRSNPMLNVWNDIRHAARMLRNNPGFTAVALFTLALCLGANLTIFAVMDSILLRPLPFPAAQRLVTVYQTFRKSGVPHAAASYPNYYDYREKISAFESTAIITGNSEPAIVGEPGSPYRVLRDRVSPEFFRTLGVPLLMGRSFTDAEMVYSRSLVAVVTYEFWQSYLNGDPHVLGRKFQMDGVPITVIGVLPRNYRYLSRHTQFYIPAATDPQERAIDQRHNNRVQLIARLAPQATVAAAQAQVSALNAEQLKDDPVAEILQAGGFFSVVKELHQDHVETIRPTLLLLECAVLFLLLIGAVNLVNLLLIRASGRAKELAIRQSLGAARGHVVSQVMTETVLLTVIGGLLGLAVAAAGIRLLETLGVNQLPLGSYIAFDGRLALAALASAVVLGILIALPVAWFALRGHLANVMQTETRGGTASRAAQHLRHSFIVAQIALAFVLLTGAGLLGISLKRVLETSPGFQTEQVLTGQISLPYKKYPNPQTQLAVLERLLTAIRAEPGVTAAGIGDLLPFSGHGDNGITSIEGIPTAKGGSQRAHYRNGVVGDYSRVMGIPLIEGRFLEDADNRRAQRACVVDRAFAQRYWPGQSPLGRRLNDGPVFLPDEALTIVGVVGTVKQTELDDLNPLGTIYYPYKYWPDPEISVVVRTAVAPQAMASELRRTVLQIDPELPIENLKPVADLIDDSLVTRRSPAVLAGIFAAVALLLTAVGTYGVLAYAVSQRRREIGVRMALGAQPGQVLAQFFGLGARLLLVGIALGLFGAWVTGRAMQNLLFGVGAMHFGVLAATAAVMIGVVLLATLVPSRRASLVSPVEALRE